MSGNAAQRREKRRSFLRLKGSWYSGYEALPVSLEPIEPLTVEQLNALLAEEGPLTKWLKANGRYGRTTP